VAHKLTTFPAQLDREIPDGHPWELHLDLSGDNLPDRPMVHVKVLNDEDAMLEGEALITQEWDVPLTRNGQINEAQGDLLITFSHTLIPDIEITLPDGGVYRVPIVDGKKATPAPAGGRRKLPPRPSGVQIGGSPGGGSITMPQPRTPGAVVAQPTVAPKIAAPPAQTEPDDETLFGSEPEDEAATSARARPPIAMGPKEPDKTVTLRPGPPLAPVEVQRTPSVVAADVATDQPTTQRDAAPATNKPVAPAPAPKRRASTRWLFGAVALVGVIGILAAVGMTARSWVSTDDDAPQTSGHVVHVDAAQPDNGTQDPPEGTGAPTEPAPPTPVEPEPVAAAPEPEPTPTEPVATQVPTPPPEPEPEADPVTKTPAATSITPTNCAFVGREKTTRKYITTSAPGVEGRYVLRCRQGLFAAEGQINFQTQKWTFTNFTRLNEQFEPVSDP